MKHLTNRLTKLEQTLQPFVVEFGCKTSIGENRAEHVLGQHRRVTSRKAGETQASFRAQVRKDADTLNREIFPNATIILEADAKDL